MWPTNLLWKILNLRILLLGGERGGIVSLVTSHPLSSCLEHKRSGEEHLTSKVRCVESKLYLWKLCVFQYINYFSLWKVGRCWHVGPINHLYFQHIQPNTINTSQLIFYYTLNLLKLKPLKWFTSEFFIWYQMQLSESICLMWPWRKTGLIRCV